MKEFPTKPLMCFELLKILLSDGGRGGAIVSFSFSPLLNKFTFLGY